MSHLGLSRPLASSLAAFLLGTPALLAQTTTTPTGASAPEAETTIELSPFVVSSEQDQGYAPNETLSGTRIRTQVRDTPSALTVLTPDLLKDLGATAYTDVLDFLPSTAVYSTSESDTNANGPRTGTPMTVRGFRSDTLTLNFFGTITGVDGYNTSRMTFSRGPNSILFGIGNPGGGADLVTNRASLRRNSAEFEMRADSFGGRRAVVHGNQVLSPGVLALHVDLLHDDRGNNIQPTKDRRDSQFITLQAKVAAGTEVTFNFENTAQRRQMPRPTVTSDSYTPWVAAGRPIVATAGSTKATPGIEFLATGGYTVFIPELGAANWGKQAYGGRWIVDGARSYNVSFNAPVVVPLDVYVGGDGDHNDLNSHQYTAILHQRLPAGLALEVAAYREDFDRKAFEGVGGNQAGIMVDANAQLPNGAPNPNVGLPYVEGNALSTNMVYTTTQVRTGLSHQYRLPGRRWFGRQLGTIATSLMIQQNLSHQYIEFLREVNTTPLPGLNPRLDNTVNNINRRSYLRPDGPNYFVSDYAPINSGGVHSALLPVASVPRNVTTRIRSWVFATQASLLDQFLVVTAGARRDASRVSQYEFVKDALGVYPDPHYGTPGPVQNAAKTTTSLGAVLNVTRRFALFANRANNFSPQSQTSLDVFGRMAPPSQGKGMDAGAKFFLWDDRLVGSCSYYVSEQTNITDNSIRGNKQTWIDQIWSAIDPSRQAGTGWTDFKDVRSSGYEFQLTANPTSRLRLMATASYGHTELAVRAPNLQEYLQVNAAEWAAKAATPVVSNNGATVGDLVAQIQKQLADDLSAVGGYQTRTFGWQANGIARWQLDGVLPVKGWAVGTAYRWRAAPIIGYAKKGAVLDITRPYKGAITTNLDLWTDYARTIGRGKIKWTLQLRVENALNENDLVPWQAYDDGTGGRFVTARLTPRERKFVASTSFAF